MATVTACSALADALAGVVRAKRVIVSEPRSTPVLVLLGALAELGELRASDLAEYLGLDVSTISRHLSALRSQGLVTSRPSLADARSQPVSLTPAGQDELSRLHQGLTERLSDHLSGWDDERVTLLADLLDDFVHTTSTEAPSAPGPAHPRARRN
jgi:DNA-binding MarR family transcriptional regulator